MYLHVFILICLYYLFIFMYLYNIISTYLEAVKFSQFWGVFTKKKAPTSPPCRKNSVFLGLQVSFIYRYDFIEQKS